MNENDAGIFIFCTRKFDIYQIKSGGTRKKHVFLLHVGTNNNEIWEITGILFVKIKKNHEMKKIV